MGKKEEKLVYAEKGAKTTEYIVSSDNVTIDKQVIAKGTPILLSEKSAKSLAGKVQTKPDWARSSNENALAEENKALKKENAELSKQAEEIEKLKKENEALKAKK